MEVKGKEGIVCESLSECWEGCFNEKEKYERNEGRFFTPFLFPFHHRCSLVGTRVRNDSMI